MVGALDRMGFRGSRVQIPASRPAKPNKIKSLGWHRELPSLALACSCKSLARESAAPHACLFLGVQEPRYRLAVEGGEPRQLDRIEPPLPTLHFRYECLPQFEALGDLYLSKAGVQPGLPQKRQHALVLG